MPQVTRHKFQAWAVRYTLADRLVGHVRYNRPRGPLRKGMSTKRLRCLVRVHHCNTWDRHRRPSGCWTTGLRCLKPHRTNRLKRLRSAANHTQARINPDWDLPF